MSLNRYHRTGVAIGWQLMKAVHSVGRFGTLGTHLVKISAVQISRDGHTGVRKICGFAGLSDVSRVEVAILLSKLDQRESAICGGTASGGGGPS